MIRASLARCIKMFLILGECLLVASIDNQERLEKYVPIQLKAYLNRLTGSERRMTPLLLEADEDLERDIDRMDSANLPPGLLLER